jgi:hypothetical protein
LNNHEAGVNVLENAKLCIQHKVIDYLLDLFNLISDIRLQRKILTIVLYFIRADPGITSISTKPPWLISFCPSRRTFEFYLLHWKLF